jgi:hypothetical protein
MDNDPLALILIFGTRGLAPLAIFRWPFWGGLLCILFDGTDVIIEDAIAPGVITDYYHNIDKTFDTTSQSKRSWHCAGPIRSPAGRQPPCLASE